MVYSLWSNFAHHRMGWLCQLPARLVFFARTRRLVRALIVVLTIVLYCEFLHYYVVLLMCTWPFLSHSGVQDPGITEVKPLRAMFIADTHIMSSNAHWFDRLRREWQMTRSFQSSMVIHRPDVVFILGDLLDEGKSDSREEFDQNVARFKKMFRTPDGVETQVIVGNHDVGFHYVMSDNKINRFTKAFDSPSVELMQKKDSLFVLVNSMSMEGDGCSFCKDAEKLLSEIKWKLKCSKGWKDTGEAVATICTTMEDIHYSPPILLQHFPMYRASDINCTTPDAAPDEEKEIAFKQRWDCLSEESTKQLFEMIGPRLVISAHTHHGCFRVHDNGVPEWTVASYNWRNKKNPSFLLAELSGTDYTIKRCYLPNEVTVISLYVSGLFLLLLCLVMPNRVFKTSGNKELIIVDKSH